MRNALNTSRISKIEYIEYLRVFSAFFVIMIHVGAPYVKDINNDSWKYLIMWASSVRFPVNFFIWFPAR